MSQGTAQQAQRNSPVFAAMPPGKASVSPSNGRVANLREDPFNVTGARQYRIPTSTCINCVVTFLVGA